jgi:hypothetical protein
MTEGVHTARFDILHRTGSGWLGVGVIGTQFDDKTECHASDGQFGWTWRAFCGELRHNSDFTDWAGQQGYGAGDMLELRLDLDKGNLIAFKNSVLLGVIESGLVGSFRWGVEMCYAGDVIRVGL